MGTVSTQSINSRLVKYRDVIFSFKANPNTGDVGVKKDVEAIRQSVMNIVATSRGERPFNPQLGGSLREYLFEQLDNVTLAVIRDHIIHVLGIYEPRVRVLDVSIQTTNDPNEIQIDLEVLILTAPEIVTNIEFTVERIR